MKAIRVGPEVKVRALVLCVLGALAVAVLVVLPQDSDPVSRPTPAESGASLVATAPVEAAVTEVPLTGAAVSQRTRGLQTLAIPGRARIVEESETTLISSPQPVDGFATVGLTWRGDQPQTPQAAQLSARTRTDGVWSTWTSLEYDADHEPDPDSTEARDVRPGTEPFVVGAVDDVQVKVVLPGAVPVDLSLAIVDPGADPGAAAEEPAITGDSDEAGEGEAGESSAEGSAALSAASSSKTPSRPAIFSRSQWGADERLRDKSSLRYGQVKMGFIHHTVSANAYTRAQVPGMMRGIYAYHTRSRGWSDIGYNFLVDRFGRIWEGRYGGVNRAPVGAHTLGYNESAFAMSAIGNFDVTAPSKAMVRAYTRLFAWKLSLHGVRAKSTQTAAGRRFAAVSGHRDAGSTACPGRYLYAKIPAIRASAAKLQGSFAARQRRTSFGSDPAASLVVRNARTGRAGLWRIERTDSGPRIDKVRTNVDLRAANKLLTVGDWDADGYGDFIARRASDKKFLLYRGKRDRAGQARFAAPVRFRLTTQRFTGYVPAGDITGDGRGDLIGRDRTGRFRVLPSNGTRGFKPTYLLGSRAKGLIGVGLWNTDGAPDFVQRTEASNLRLRAGNGPGYVSSAFTTLGNVAGYTAVRGVGDAASTPRVDLVARRVGTESLYLFPGRRSEIKAPRLLTDSLGRIDLLG